MVNQINKISTTTSYKYGNNDVEYVLCSRGRPFVTLLSPNTPTPTSSLIDHNLVRELGLKIGDLQCKKFFYCGEQLRILGTISTTVQCVSDGFVSGSFQLTANVIEHLQTNFDVHSIAGMKLTKMLQPDVPMINENLCTSSGAPSQSPSSPPPSSKKLSPSRVVPTLAKPEPTTTKAESPLPTGSEVNNIDDVSNLFLLQWNAALDGSGDTDDQPVSAVVKAEPVATDGCKADPVKITLLTMTEDSTADVWPGGVGSKQPIPWCHPEAHLVPWLVDDELSPNILCVNGKPSHYARGNCVQCQAPIDPDATIDPNVSMCTNCYIKEEIGRRKKRK